MNIGDLVQAKSDHELRRVGAIYEVLDIRPVVSQPGISRKFYYWVDLKFWGARDPEFSTVSDVWSSPMTHIEPANPMLVMAIATRGNTP